MKSCFMFIRKLWSVPVFTLFFLLMPLSLSSAHGQTLVAEWRMDEGQWNNNSGDVIDSSGTGNHGTPKNGPNTAPSKLCRGGWFRGEGYNAAPNNTWYTARYHIEVDDHDSLSPQTSDAISIVGWIRPDTLTGTQTILHKGGSSESQEYRVFVENGKLKFTVWNKDGGSYTLEANHNLVAGTWYFFTTTAERVGNSHNVRLTAKVFNASSSSPLVTANTGPESINQSGKNTSGRLIIGATNWGNSITQYFNGMLDELRIYNGLLDNNDDINAIKNATRTCPTSLTCITDDFARTVLGDDWSVTSKSGNFGNPQIISNRLRLTNASSNVATSSTFQKAFPAEDNRVILEFDYFAYGGSSADGISIVFSDALITPEPGGYGGSLGYANRSGTSGFAGGWLGIGLDTFGNYSNPTEGRSGGPGSRKNAVAMRGSGIGQTGYRYLSGTTTLDPILRTSTGHRYRVTVDSRIMGQAMVKVERNTGSGFTTLIDTINVLSLTGQAAVPDNLLLTLTGSTGGSNDNHEIDNVQICAVKMNPINNAIHHFRIEHDGDGLTCSPEAVKITACADNNCNSKYLGNVQITHNNGTFNFSGGEGTFYLSRTTPGTITIGISSSTPSAANTLRCTNTSGGTACNLIFSDVGIQLDGDAEVGKTPIATQIAGKPSNIDHNAAIQKIRAVIKDTQTGACIPALQNQTRSVNFRYQLPSVPDEGLNDASFIIAGIGTGTTSNTLTAANAQKSVQLLFDNTGSAPFSFTPSDAGRYILRADMDIPVVDSNNNPTGTTLSRNDSSLEFVVRPLAVFVDASGNPKALDHSGTVFKKAGEAFDLTFSATRWVAGADDDNDDGIWDKCQDTSLALPGITRVPAWLLGKPAPELVEPESGAGNLTYGDGDTSFSAKSSSATASNVNFSDVGIIQFRGQSTFLGQNVSVCSPYIGRFIPDHFKVEVTPPLPCPTIDCPSPSGGAAYATQDFITKVTALNRAGGITSNYQGDFGRAIALTAHIAKGGSGTPTSASAGTLSNGTAENFTAGSVTLNNVQYAFNSPPGAPINIHLRAVESAGDSVSSLRTAPAAASDSIEDGIKIIQGRLRLSNAYGTVQRPQPMDVRTQYWSGNSWVKWADGSSKLKDTLFSITPTGTPTTNMTKATLNKCDINGNNCVPIASSVEELSPSWKIGFSPNGGSNGTPGSAKVCANLATMPWLQNPSDPCAKVTFGVYPAESKKTVHIRELY